MFLNVEPQGESHLLTMPSRLKGNAPNL
uniref:Uncharacterized protein n=1 Tax=Anguilla anguilla TaxID=7936 RepID=A0A0E9XUM8_ANGAN